MEATNFKYTYYEADQVVLRAAPAARTPRLDVRMDRLGSQPDADPYELLADLLKQTKDWPTPMPDATRWRGGVVGWGCGRVGWLRVGWGGLRCASGGRGVAAGFRGLFGEVGLG